MIIQLEKALFTSAKVNAMNMKQLEAMILEIHFNIGISFLSASKNKLNATKQIVININVIANNRKPHNLTKAGLKENFNK